MQTYFDTGALVPLYVEEVFSAVVTAYVESRNEAIPINLLHQVEMENALRLKMFRGEMHERQLQAVLKQVGKSLDDGKLFLRPVNWVNALEATRQLSHAVTAKHGCRSLDLIHVAVAAQWECKTLVTADGRQTQAARAAGLRVVDLRTALDQV